MTSLIKTETINVAKKTVKKAGVYDEFTTYSEDGADLPIMTQKDLFKASPNFLEKLLKCQKYQNIIAALKSPTEMNASGIVNFVTGADTASHLVEGVLKSAFPPGSREIYKEDEVGYGFDASTWDESTLKELLDGEPARYDENTYEDAIEMVRELVSPSIRGVKMDFSKTDEELAAEIREATARSESEGAPAENTRASRAILNEISTARQNAIKRFNVHMANLANEPGASFPVDGTSYFTPKGQRPQGGPAWAGLTDQNAPPQDDANKMALWRITQIREAQGYLIECVSRKRDPKTPAKQKEMLNSEIIRWTDVIREHRSHLPLMRHGIGTQKTDRTGFMHYQPYDFSMNIAILESIANYKMFVENFASISSGVSEDEDKKQEAYVAHVDNAIMRSRADFAEKGIEGPVVTELDNLAKLVSYGGRKGYKTRFAEIKNNLEKIQESIVDITADMSDMQHEGAVMIVANADQSALKERPTTQQTAQTTTIKRNESLIRYSKKHGRRCIVFVSETPMTFAGFGDAVPVVRLDSPVDIEEAKTLVGITRDEIMRLLVSKNYPAAAAYIALEKTDENRIINVIQGQNHTAAYTILYKAFKDSFDKFDSGESELILGKDIAKNVTKRINENVLEGRGSNGLALGDTSMEFEDYIYDEDTDWGAQIDLWVEQFRAIERLQIQIDKREARLADLEMEENSDEEVARLKLELSQLNTALDGKFNSISNFILLYGSAGVGKTVFVQAFAKRLHFTYGKIEMGKATGQYAGQREAAMNNFRESMYSLHNAVLLWDEIDKDIAGDTSAGLNYWEGRANKTLLSMMDEDAFHLNLKKNRVFIIATANNPENMNQAIVNRSEPFNVPSPYTAMNYEKYLRKAVSIIKRHRPVPNFIGQASTPEEAWKLVEKQVNSINLAKVGQAFEGSGVNFRKMEPWLMLAIDMSVFYESGILYKKMYDKCLPDQDGFPHDMQAFQEFKTTFDEAVEAKEGRERIKIKPTLKGFPWTEDNLIKAANMTKGRDSSETEGKDLAMLSKNGVIEVAKEWRSAALSWESEGKDWSSADFSKAGQEKTQQLKFEEMYPAEGQTFKPEDKVQQPAPPVAAPAQQEEPDVIVPVNRTPSMTVKNAPGQAEEKQNPVVPPKKSSTDHYLDALIKSGLLNEDEIK